MRALREVGGINGSGGARADAAAHDLEDSPRIAATAEVGDGRDGGNWALCWERRRAAAMLSSSLATLEAGELPRLVARQERRVALRLHVGTAVRHSCRRYSTYEEGERGKDGRVFEEHRDRRLLTIPASVATCPSPLVIH